MPRAVRLLLFVVLALALLLAASGFLVRAMLSGSSKDALVERLGQAAGVAIRVEAVEFDLAAWYRLQPAVALRGVRAGNPAGFRSESLVEAERLESRVELIPLFSGDVRVRSVVLRRPRVFVEQRGDGTTNLEVFLKGLGGGAAGGASSAGGGRAAGGGGTRLAIERLEVSEGEIRVVGPAGVTAPRAFHAIEIKLDGFAPGRPCRLELSSRLYSGNVSRLRVEGTAGPFAPSSIPVAGKLTATLSPAEIPLAFRRERFGSLLEQVPGEARIALEASLNGDAYDALSGSGAIAVSGLHVGGDAGRRLALEGKAAASVAIRRLTSAPVVEVSARSAELRLGSGRWRGDLEVVSSGGVARGASSGSVSGVDINEFVTAFASSPDKIDGRLEVPAYKLRFSGKDALGIKNSLTGEARLEVTEGRLKALDLLGAILRAVESKDQAQPSPADTQFSTLTTGLSVGGQKLSLAGLALTGPGLKATGDGTIGFDHALSVRLNALVGGRIAELLGKRSEEGAAGEASVPVLIAGTVDHPSVRPDVRRMAVGAARSLLGDFLRRRLEPKKQQPK
jgi:hypothetical protein